MSDIDRELQAIYEEQQRQVARLDSLMQQAQDGQERWRVLEVRRTTIAAQNRAQQVIGARPAIKVRR